MSDIISLQNLAGSVNAIEQSVEQTRLSVLFQSKSNSSNLSEYHLRFGQLMNKYSGFAEEYRSELSQFYKLLLSTIQSKQLQEKQRLEKLERLEVISNSNLEIVDNEPFEYSPANSVANQQVNSSTDQHSEPEPEPEPIKTATVSKKANKSNKSNKPKPIKKKEVPVPVPVSAPAPIKAAKPTKSVQKNNTKKQTKNKSRKNATKNIIKPVVIKKENKDEEKKENKENKKNVSNMNKPYEYNADKIPWYFDGVQRSSTMIYIGNLPWDLPQQTASNRNSDEIQKQYNSKICQLQYFIQKKAKVGLMQIEETQLRHGWNSMYAIVRFRSDVKLKKISKFIDEVNKENKEFAEQRKKEKKGTNINPGWKRKIFIKENNNFRYYESEDAMYSDPDANRTLFIRNFDILNDKCHEELTYTMLDYGDLCNDIEIRVDRYGDPYCTVQFKYINDAIYCCNSEINFNGRTLEMRYSKF